MRSVPINVVIVEEDDSSIDEDPTAYSGSNPIPRYKRVRKHIIVAILVCVMIISRSIEFVLYVRLTKKMQHYLFMLSNVFLPLGALIVDVPICLFQIFVSKTVTTEMRRSSWKQYFIMGTLDAIGMLLATIASSFLTGPLNASVSASIIGIHMILAYFIAKARFNVLHVCLPLYILT
jgi:hypothetical protein